MSKELDNETQATLGRDASSDEPQDPVTSDEISKARATLNELPPSCLLIVKLVVWDQLTIKQAAAQAGSRSCGPNGFF